MLYDYQTWSEELLMQAKNDDDLCESQRSTEVKYREYPCFGLAAILTGTLYCVQIIQKNNMHME